jgi:hypothetical protein
MSARAVALLLALLPALGSCTIDPPFARTNHFDPEADVTMRLVGPDSVHGVGTRFRMTIEATPALPDRPLFINWDSSHPTMVVDAGNGEFVVINAGFTYTQVFITANLRDVVVGTTVWVGRR